MTLAAATLYETIWDSPCGPLGLLVDERGAVVRIEFFGDRYREHHRRQLKAAGGRVVRDAERTAPLARQLGEYFAGRRRTFELELAPAGTFFQLAVWRMLRTIPFGSTWSYSQLATAIGRPDASRAVGSANGANPIPIVIPCHRVIGANGSLTGFGGGLANKRLLLDLEGVSAPAERQLELGL